MKKLIITIDSDAKATVEADGYKGKGCAVDSKVIQDALGIVTKDVKKPEYSQDAGVNQCIGG